MFINAFIKKINFFIENIKFGNISQADCNHSKMPPSNNICYNAAAKVLTSACNSGQNHQIKKKFLWKNLLNLLVIYYEALNNIIQSKMLNNN